jgi:hypothetical protein
LTTYDDDASSLGGESDMFASGTDAAVSDRRKSLRNVVRKLDAQLAAEEKKAAAGVKVSPRCR